MSPSPSSVTVPQLCQRPPALSPSPNSCHRPPALSPSPQFSHRPPSPALSPSPKSIIASLLCHHPPALSSHLCSVTIPRIRHRISVLPSPKSVIASLFCHHPNPSSHLCSAITQIRHRISVLPSPKSVIASLFCHHPNPSSHLCSVTIPQLCVITSLFCHHTPVVIVPPALSLSPNSVVAPCSVVVLVLPLLQQMFVIRYLAPFNSSRQWFTPKPLSLSIRMLYQLNFPRPYTATYAPASSHRHSSGSIIFSVIGFLNERARCYQTFNTIRTYMTLVSVQSTSGVTKLPFFVCV